MIIVSQVQDQVKTMTNPRHDRGKTKKIGQQRHKTKTKAGKDRDKTKTKAWQDQVITEAGLNPHSYRNIHEKTNENSSSFNTFIAMCEMCTGVSWNMSW